jgi:malonyl-CoA/methylmalonyl-CoA synthetase
VQSLYLAFRGAWQQDSVFLRTPFGRCWTYAELDTVTADLALRLRGAGLAQGDRLVAVVERSEWNIFLYLACVRVGVVYVPLNPRLTASELAPVVADGDPALVVCDPSCVSTLHAIFAGELHTLDQAGKGSLLELERGAGEPDVPLPDGAAAAIIFTSGTTGRPKGALMPHALFVGKARSLGSALGYTSADCLLHTLPLYHAHGLFMTLHCVLTAGASMLLLPRFDAAQVVGEMPHATLFSGVPTMYKRLLDEPGLRAAAAGMRLFISGSAALPREVFASFEQQSGHRILECWGMSETMTNTANPLNGERRPGSAGQALPGVTLRAVDGEGRPLPPGVPGTLEVGFPVPFGGYWRRPPAEQPVIRGGCLVTGDIGAVDADGYLTIVGRSSEVIISGGYNVYPREVEIALEELPGIGRAAVFALPHADFGEAVVAAVEPAAGAVLDAPELLRKLRSCLVGYKLPKALFIEAALPLTELGKIQRKALATKYFDYFDERI